jgi:uncharacterized protein YjbJ (UPF0337 family)
MESAWDETKGRAKEAVGDLTDDPELETEGKLDRAGAKVKKMAEKGADRVEEAVDALKKKLSRD